MKLTSIALASALSLAAVASYAQPASPPGPMHGQAMGQGMGGQRPDPAQMAERHAQRMRDALQLRPDQEPALRALIAAMQPTAAAMQAMRAQHEAMRTLPMPERLDRMQAMMADRQARFRQRADAIKRFYAQLTPAQQKAFDAMPMMGGGMMGHGRMGGGRGMGQWMGHGMGPGTMPGGEGPEGKPPK